MLVANERVSFDIADIRAVREEFGVLYKRYISLLSIK